MNNTPLPLIHFQRDELFLLAMIAGVGYFFLGKTAVGIFLYSERFSNAALAIVSIGMLVIDPVAIFSNVAGLSTFAAITNVMRWMFAIVGGASGALALASFLPTEWETSRELGILAYSLFTRKLPVDRSALDFDAYAAKNHLATESRSYILRRVERATNDAGAALFAVEARDGKTFVALTAAGVDEEVSAERMRATNTPERSVKDLLSDMARARRGLD